MYDPHIDEGPCPFTGARVYVVATKHDEFGDPDWPFPAGSVVIDPWRYVPRREGVEVVHVGVGVGNSGQELTDVLGGRLSTAQESLGDAFTRP
jgi:hypothetical protein